MRLSHPRQLEDMNWADYSDALDNDSLERVIAGDSMQRRRDRKSVSDLRRQAQTETCIDGSSNTTTPLDQPQVGSAL